MQGFLGLPGCVARIDTLPGKGLGTHTWFSYRQMWWVGSGLTGWQVTNWSIWAADGRGVRHDLVSGDDQPEEGGREDGLPGIISNLQFEVFRIRGKGVNGVKIIGVRHDLVR